MQGEMMKRILVTGGAGFLGQHLCMKLLEQGNSVFCLDNFSTSLRKNLRQFEDGYPIEGSEPNFEWIDSDVQSDNSSDIFDEIYNLACPASPIYYQKHPIETFQASVLGAFSVLRMANDLGIKVLQASTSEVYGDSREHPQEESYWGNVNPIGKRSCYDEGKRAAECLFMDFHRQHKTKIKIVRIFNTFGPGMLPNDGRVVSTFIQQALKNKDITIFGNGSQTRSLCYVDDMIDGMVKMMESPDDFTGPVNLGNPDEITIGGLADLICNLTKSKSRLVYRELPQDDPKRRCPDITLAKEKLGWEPKVKLIQGLEKTIYWFKKELKL